MGQGSHGVVWGAGGGGWRWGLNTERYPVTIPMICIKCFIHFKGQSQYRGQSHKAAKSQDSVRVIYDF